jgi:hypothetical protein
VSTQPGPARNENIKKETNKQNEGVVSWFCGWFEHFPAQEKYFRTERNTKQKQTKNGTEGNMLELDTFLSTMCWPELLQTRAEATVWRQGPIRSERTPAQTSPFPRQNRTSGDPRWNCPRAKPHGTESA